jgi:3D (Asp-Asp-Asp) domain-containing protein
VVVLAILATLVMAGYLLQLRQGEQASATQNPPSLARVDPVEIARSVVQQDSQRRSEPNFLQAKPDDVRALPFDRYLRHEGQLLRAVGEMEMEVTAYCADEESCAPFNDGITASGLPVTTNGGRLVAADTDVLPFGTLVSVPGYAQSQPVPVLDRGGAIKGRKLDLLMPDRDEAMQWGRQMVRVIVWEVVE